MDDNFLISWTKYDKEKNDPIAGDNGAEFKITTFKDLHPTDNYNLCRAQLIVNKHRMKKTELDNMPDKWNNITYEDIDLKKWYRDGTDKVNEQKLRDYPVLVVFANIYNWIKSKYKYNINDAELSRSKLGFHFYFKWDCEKTNENRDYYKAVSVAIVKTAFIECSYRHIIEYPGVYDDCTDSNVQLVYPTKNNWIHNYECNGKITYYGDLNIDKSKIIKKKDKELKDKYKELTGINIDYGDNRIFEVVEVIDPDKVEYIEHQTRWRLFDSLSRIYKDNELRENWIRCANLIPENNNHTTNFYREEPYKNYESYTWNKMLNGKEYCDIELLEAFGYKVQIKKANNSLCFDNVLESIINDNKKETADNSLSVINILNNLA